jgi:NADPH-dependent 2,4-dienoyl-CoA reductase/sulfur reductase-like enzyme
VVAIGGSDAGISAALRARELAPDTEVTVVVADAYPNFSICGIPYYVSGAVSHWRNLAHRSVADLEAIGMKLRLDTVARRIRAEDHKLLVQTASGADELRLVGDRHRRGVAPSADRRPHRPRRNRGCRRCPPSSLDG